MMSVKTSLIGRVIALLLASCLVGCSHTTSITGYQKGDATLDADRVKRWSPAVLTSAWGVSTFGPDFKTEFSGWCDAAGDWGIEHEISDCAISLLVTTQFEFGHIENRDMRTFEPIATHVTQETKIAKGTVGRSAAVGSDPAIQADFDRINAIRPTYVARWGFLFPISWKSEDHLVATPGGPYEAGPIK